MEKPWIPIHRALHKTRKKKLPISQRKRSTYLIQQWQIAEKGYRKHSTHTEHEWRIDEIIIEMKQKRVKTEMLPRDQEQSVRRDKRIPYAEKRTHLNFARRFMQTAAAWEL